MKLIYGGLGIVTLAAAAVLVVGQSGNRAEAQMSGSRQYALDATTVGGESHVYMIDSQSGRLLFCRTAAGKAPVCQWTQVPA